MRANRGWNISTLRLMQEVGLLRFGRYFGFDCWFALDQSGLCAEARRMDDKPFPAGLYKGKDYNERKAQAVKYSRKKDWPVGIFPALLRKDPSYAIVMCEGGTDFVSAYDFVYRQKRNDILPTAMLGKGMGLHGFHPDCWDRLRGRRVRIYPHNDDSGDGLRKGLHWANQLLKLECRVDFFVFEDVSKADGTPAKDLTECIGLNLEELFP
jgi:hypothetical protein